MSRLKASERERGEVDEETTAVRPCAHART
jgi:hypothetical protein